MNKSENQQKKTAALPTAEQLRKNLAKETKTNAMTRIRSFFDAKTFVELGAYTARDFRDGRKEELEGVICGYGAVGGKLVFAFAQDGERMKGALDASHAKKICRLYDMAEKNGAPVVALLDCAGADVFEGVAAMAGYGQIMRAVSHASGVIPQIAVVLGNCIGSFAAVASMFDFVVLSTGGNLYVNTPQLTGVTGAQDRLLSYNATGEADALSYTRNLLSYLPDNCRASANAACQDDLNRLLPDLNVDEDAAALLSSLADEGNWVEVGSGADASVLTAFMKIGGVACGVLANVFAENEGRLSAGGAQKAARFVDFCDAFRLPLVTLVNSCGFVISKENESAGFASALGRLAMAFTSSQNAKITVVLHHAIGGAFPLLGSKSVGADVAYALDDTEISPLSTEAAVAFAENNQITTSLSREELEDDWRRNMAAPIVAASLGEIDDIIPLAELRQRICSSLFLLSSKGNDLARRHNVLPL